MTPVIPPAEVKIRCVEATPFDYQGWDVPPSHALVAEWQSPEGLFRAVGTLTSPIGDEDLELFRPHLVALLEREYLKARAQLETGS